MIRDFLSYLPGSVLELPPVTSGADPAGPREESLAGAVPRNPRQPYRIGPVLAAIFDQGSVFPYAEYGGGTVTALARLGGHPVGRARHRPVPGHHHVGRGRAGDHPAGRPVRDVPPAARQPDRPGRHDRGRVAEERATIRFGARAIAAVYQARVPQAELILRRVYGVGGAGIINRHRAGRSWAWPSGDWGSLPVQGGVEAAFRAELEQAADPAAEPPGSAASWPRCSSPFRTAEQFGVQDLIDPRDSPAAAVRVGPRRLPGAAGADRPAVVRHPPVTTSSRPAWRWPGQARIMRRVGQETLRQATEADRFRLAYERAGSGPAVLLLHGWPGDRADYRDMVPLLAPDADVVVPDLRGFGESDKHPADPAEQYTAAAQARSVIALIGELELDRPVLAGLRHRQPDRPGHRAGPPGPGPGAGRCPAAARHRGPDPAAGRAAGVLVPGLPPARTVPRS